MPPRVWVGVLLDKVSVPVAPSLIPFYKILSSHFNVVDCPSTLVWRGNYWLRQRLPWTLEGLQFSPRGSHPDMEDGT